MYSLCLLGWCCGERLSGSGLLWPDSVSSELTDALCFLLGENKNKILKQLCIRNPLSNTFICRWFHYFRISHMLNEIKDVAGMSKILYWNVSFIICTFLFYSQAIIRLPMNAIYPNTIETTSISYSSLVTLGWNISKHGFWQTKLQITTSVPCSIESQSAN